MEGEEVSMRPQGVVFPMGKMSCGSWAVWFGFFWCFNLLVCALFRRVKIGVRQFVSIAGLQAIGQRNVRTTRRWQQKVCQEPLPESIGGQIGGFFFFFLVL